MLSNRQQNPKLKNSYLSLDGLAIKWELKEMLELSKTYGDFKFSTEQNSAILSKSAFEII